MFNQVQWKNALFRPRERSEWGLPKAKSINRSDKTPQNTPTFEPFWLWCLLFDLQTSVRGQNGVEFYQESTGHIRFFLALLLAKIANERLKILVFLLFDLQTSVRAQVWVLYQKMYFIYILWVLFILISFKLKCQGFNLFILLLGFSFQCFSLI